MLSPAPKIPPGLIGFDFDGVIADIGEAFVRLACTRYGHCDLELEQINSFQVDQCVDIPIETIEKIFDEILEDSIATGLKPIDGAISSLKRLNTYGPVTIITARPEIEPVEDWLRLHFGDQVDSIRLISSGHHDDKERYIRQQNIIYFVDDRLHTCRMLAESGLRPMIFAQPWNRDHHNLPSVNNWQELIDLLDL